jgi:hypothetical protein
MRSDAGDAAPVIEGEAVVAFAMGYGLLLRNASPLWQEVVNAAAFFLDVIVPRSSRLHCGWIIIGESRSVLLSASAAPSVVSTVV